MASIHGVRSFASLRSRARVVAFDGARLLVADLADVTRSREPRAARGIRRGLQYLRRPSMKKRVTRKAKLEALKKESDLALRDQIRRWLALPPDRRTHFLRRRLAYRISCL